MLFVVCGALAVVDCCLRFVVGCLLSIVRRALFVVGCRLCAACCVLFDVVLVA